MECRFQAILRNLYIALAGVEPGADGKDYANLFVNNPDLRKEFYSYFGLSGATFVVADNQRRCFVLLQEGARDVGDHPVRFELPISELPTNKSILPAPWDGQQMPYNRFCNRIFQIQRGQEGLREYRTGPIVLTREPEFLTMLEARTTASVDHESHPPTARHKDWKFCAASEMSIGLLCWRWLIWIADNWGSSHTIQADAQAYYCREPRQNSRRPTASRYFDKSFFVRNRELNDPEFPELSILKLDDEASWSDRSDLKLLFPKWNDLRQQLDGFTRCAVDFQPELDAILNIYPALVMDLDAGLSAGSTAHEIMVALHGYMLNSLKGAPSQKICDLLAHLHDTASAPLPAYYYFVMLDGRPKEHLIVPVMRSERYPIRYYIHGEDTRKEHSAVVIALASINAGVPQLKEDELRLLEFKTALRICADRIIDAIFINSIAAAEGSAAIERGSRVFTATQTREIPSVFVLGSFDKRVSFISQQSRALILVRSLFEEEVLHEFIPQALGGRTSSGKPIAIIGGGVAGVTAAAALLLFGCEVCLFEKREHLLELQSSADHRFVHPHIYDWPSYGYQDVNARLPILNWTADYGDKVIEQIGNDFAKFCSRYIPVRKLHIETKRTIDKISYVTKGSAVRLRYPMGNWTRDFGMVIVAIGYGPEAAEIADDHRSYWERDLLVERSNNDDGPREILVSGSGDGGLIDLARATLGVRGSHSLRFDHRELVKKLVSDRDIRTLGELFWQADRQEAVDDLLYEHHDLYKRYDRIYDQQPQHMKKRLSSILRALKRKDTCVSFNYEQDLSVFTLHSALLHRVLCYLLLKQEWVTKLPGTLEKIETPVEQLSEKKQRVKIGNAEHEFDHIIARHGAPKTYVEKSLEGLGNLSEVFNGRLSSLEIARDLDENTRMFYEKLRLKHNL